MLKTLALIVVSLLLSGLAVPSIAADEAWDETWPQWRGPHRDGRAGGEPWPDNLGCLEPLWTVELGKGYSGPIATADKVFVAETVDKEREVVRALDRETGRELWHAEWQGSWKVPFSPPATAVARPGSR